MDKILALLAWLVYATLYGDEDPSLACLHDRPRLKTVLCRSCLGFVDCRPGLTG